MITLDIKHHGLAAIDEDEELARYDAVKLLSASRPTAERTPVLRATRALVEVQRRFGGLAPRALLGGNFTVADAKETLFEVRSGSSMDDLGSSMCPARLWKRPFIVGLPAEFSEAVLRGLVADRRVGLPAGMLTVDRAGFDQVESSSFVFAQAAALLGRVLAAKLYGGDVEKDARAEMNTW